MPLIRHRQRWIPLWFGCVGMGLCSLLVPNLAWAHNPGGTLGGFGSGFIHPIVGLDHLLAMLAVGLWGAQMDGKAVWSLPISFPLVMAVGGTLGTMKIALPAVEIFIALSLLGLGLAIAFALKPQEWVAVLVVSIFAIFHGHAHGAELPSAANPLAYGIGFVSATGLIHIAGIGLGLAATRWKRPIFLQGSGWCIGLAGIYFLLR